MEILHLLLSVLLGSISGVISGTVIVKITMRTPNLAKKIAETLHIFVKDTENQQTIFQIGALLGNGIIAGTGLEKFTPKKSVKWWEALIVQFAPTFLEKFMGKEAKTLNPLETQ